MNHEINTMMTNKLNEKILMKDNELSEKVKEIENLKNHIEKISQNYSNNKDVASTDNKSIDADYTPEIEGENNNYEENCYHTFSKNDECFKSADVNIKLFMCNNNEQESKINESNIKENIEKKKIFEENSENNLNPNPYSKPAKEFKQENFNKLNQKKITPPTHSSLNQINNIYNNNFTQFNILGQLNTKDTNENKINNSYNTNNATPPKSKKSGFNYKDILPKYNRIYLEKENSTDQLNNSVNYKKKEDKSRDKSRDINSDKFSIKSKYNKKTNLNKSIEKVIYLNESQHKSKENLNNDTSISSGSKKNFANTNVLNNPIPKHRRLLSTQSQLNKSREDVSKDKILNSTNSTMNNDKLTNPTQKLLNKYYEILSNYNKKAKKEENNSFYKDKKDFDSSINSSHGSHKDISSSTARSIDRFINSNSHNFKTEGKQRKVGSSKQAK